MRVSPIDWRVRTEPSRTVRCLDRYLLRDDSAWITRLSKDFWWNLERISEMITSDVPIGQPLNRQPNKFNAPTGQGNFLSNNSTKHFTAAPMQFAGVPPRKVVGQRAPMNNAYRTNSMFNNGFASPPPSSGSSSSSSGSTIVRPSTNNTAYTNIPDKSNFFQTFSSMSIAGGNTEQELEYNPFQSKISFDNNMWGNNAQQAIPWQ
jgi:hypothetical protein